MSYVPTGSAVSRYTPDVSDTSTRVRPVCVFRAVTVTPGTAAPCASRIRPATIPVVCWAAAGIPASAEQRTIIAAMTLLMPCSLLYWVEQDGHRGLVPCAIQQARHHAEPGTNGP